MLTSDQVGQNICKKNGKSRDFAAKKGGIEIPFFFFIFVTTIQVKPDSLRGTKSNFQCDLFQ